MVSLKKMGSLRFSAVLTCTIIFFVGKVKAEDKGDTSCVTPLPTGFDGRWFDKNGKQTWYIPMSSKLSVARPNSKEVGDPPITNTSSRRCWIAKVSTPRGWLGIPFECDFNKHEDQHCVLKTEGTRVGRKLKLFGDFTITKTDNSSYFVMLACILEEKQKFWITFSKTPTLADDVAESILTHVDANGFDRNDLTDFEDDRFSLYKMDSTKCKWDNSPDYDTHNHDDVVEYVEEGDFSAPEPSANPMSTRVVRVRPRPSRRRERLTRRKGQRHRGGGDGMDSGFGRRRGGRGRAGDEEGGMGDMGRRPGGRKRGRGGKKRQGDLDSGEAKNRTADGLDGVSGSKLTTTTEKPSSSEKDDNKAKEGLQEVIKTIGKALKLNKKDD